MREDGEGPTAGHHSQHKSGLCMSLGKHKQILQYTATLCTRNITYDAAEAEEQRGKSSVLLPPHCSSHAAAASIPNAFPVRRLAVTAILVA